MSRMSGTQGCPDAECIVRVSDGARAGQEPLLGLEIRGSCKPLGVIALAAWKQILASDDIHFVAQKTSSI